MKKKRNSSLLHVDIADLKKRLRRFPKSVKANEEERWLVMAGKLRLPQARINVADLLRIPTGRIAGTGAIQALLDEREEGR